MAKKNVNQLHLYRYMSEEEYRLLINDQTIHNRTDHHLQRGSASTAKGFCFGCGKMDAATLALQRLNGILVKPDYLLVVTAKQPSHFTKCKGRYMDYKWWNSLTLQEQRAIPIGSEKIVMMDEYCTTEYALFDFSEYSLWKVAGYDVATHRAKVVQVLA